MPALLEEYVEMIRKVDKDKRIFGHSGRGKKEEVTTCTGEQGKHGSDKEKNNEKICVDYGQNFKNGQYEIPWHNKFKEASERMNEAKKLEDKILQNHAEIVLLQSRAWIAYTLEKEDQTANLDDMNVSHLFDGAKLTHEIPLSFIFLIF
ncbi:hypothetical protein, unlikely [Trypanosoma congolense IL3000]|uniref:Trypanosome variant surface glycoprotein B-type N-terminal domain-containing protein n=1 Tax=Trypanosoma congolense (strain IL3000) TaxID=1068625 RepID=F9WJZ3_TRYCI|nr:hypothetical protein, unlikely [Trypanosoma congolense IL3000]